MKKLMLSALLAVLLLFSTIVTVSADHMHIYDEMELISSENENNCERISQEIESRYDYCVVFCFPSELDGGSVNAYCTDIYENRVNAANAVVFGHDLIAGSVGYHLAGEAGKVFSAERMDALFALYNEADTYHGGVENFLKGAADELAKVYPDKELTVNANAVTPQDDIAMTADANHAKDFVVDNADLLTDVQEDSLEEKLAALSQAHEADIVVLTERSLCGRQSLAFADDYFDYSGYGQGKDRSGMLLLYVPGPAGEREIALSTRGSLYSCVTDADSDAMIDTLIPDLVSENYVAAFDSFVRFAEEETAEIGKTKLLPVLYIPVALLIGFAVAFIVLKIQTSSLKSVRQERTARYYIQPESLVLTGRYDRFLYKNVSKTPKQTQSSSSGTSGRTSSSGATHGGTSRKF